eukprot:scaffold616_cov257-Pinguiococcus_pyrenoidosus.AAC.13
MLIIVVVERLAVPSPLRRHRGEWKAEQRIPQRLGNALHLAEEVVVLQGRQQPVNEPVVAMLTEERLHHVLLGPRAVLVELLGRRPLTLQEAGQVPLEELEVRLVQSTPLESMLHCSRVRIGVRHLAGTSVRLGSSALLSAIWTPLTS